MPIKFACSACKNVMTVDSKFAGKAGKCSKCGAAITVPAAPATGGAQRATGQAAPAMAAPAAAATPADSKAAQIAALNAAPPPSAGKLAAGGSLGHVLDELTESDYSRQSPFQNVYAPPKPKAVDHVALKRAASTAGGGEDVKKPRVGPDGRPPLTTVLIVFGVLDIVEAILYYGVVIAMAVVGLSFMDQIKDKVPFLAVGMSLLIMVFGVLATLMMASGLGLLTKQVWGYGVAVFVYSFTLGTRIVGFLSSLSNPSGLVGPGLGILFILFCTSYFFQKDCKNVFGIKSNTLALILGGIGLAIPLLIGGLLYLLGAFANIPS